MPPGDGEGVPQSRTMLPHQRKVAEFYNSVHVQVLVAAVIGANFLTNIVEKEIDPAGDKFEAVFGVFELFYNIVFTLELAINMYSGWWRNFWNSGWNVFDVIVVSIGVINMLKLPLPSAFSMLRMMRAFRVFRLFKRVHSLNKIIVAIAHAVPGVLNAFIILTIVMSIYAILAVEFYQSVGDDCLSPSGEAKWITLRGGCQGDEYFGSFAKSWYSFFQVLTGESWSEMVSRPSIWAFHDMPLHALGSGMFFVSYVLISGFVLTNVVVAVLLDKMVDPEVSEKAASEHPDAGKDAEFEDNSDGTAPVKNGETSRVATTAADLQATIDSVEHQVEQLAQKSESMGSQIKEFKSDMSSIRDQVASILRCMPVNKKLY